MRRIVEAIKALGLLAVARAGGRRSQRSQNSFGTFFKTDLTRIDRDPAGRTWQSELADRFELRGDSLLAEGMLAAALEAYRRFHAVA